VTTTVAARFWAKVKANGPDECWPWQGSLNDDGYGNFRLDGKVEKAHRVSWWLAKGRWPKKSVLHKCDSPSCQNPRHLFQGTQQDNVTDCVKKGRLNPSGRLRPGVPKRKVEQRRKGGGVGAFNGHAKLNATDVLVIRARCAAGERQVDVGDDYGIDQSAVSNIVRRRNWKHLDSE